MASDIEAKLKKADPAIRDHVSDLKARNAKLHRKIVKLEGDKMERDHRIKAFEKELKELKKPSPEFDLPDLGDVLRRARECANPGEEPAK